MTIEHECSQCRTRFAVTSKTLLKTGWGRDPFYHGPLGLALDDYDKVRCPRCGHVEQEERAKVFGLVPANTFVWLVVIFMLLLAVYAAADNFGYLR